KCAPADLKLPGQCAVETHQTQLLTGQRVTERLELIAVQLFRAKARNPRANIFLRLAEHRARSLIDVYDGAAGRGPDHIGGHIIQRGANPAVDDELTALGTDL